MTKRIIILGAGVSGLSASWRLASKGIQVDIFGSESEFISPFVYPTPWFSGRLQRGRELEVMGEIIDEIASPQQDGTRNDRLI